MKKKIVYTLECNYARKAGNNKKRIETIEKTVGKKSPTSNTLGFNLLWDFTNPVEAADAYKALSELPDLDTLDLRMREDY